MTSTRESAPSSRRRALRDILLYGVCGGILIVVLRLTEYRLPIVEHSVEIYGRWSPPCLPHSAFGWG
jgi:hypothetical protein